nr:response regulator transcription factor [uncultured Anaeromusa sp.]
MSIQINEGLAGGWWQAPTAVGEPKINLLDEDAAYSQVVAYCLEQEGWQVQCCPMEEKEAWMQGEKPDVWVIDGDSADGFRLMRELRRADEAAPIVLTMAKERILDRVTALELGCQDLVLKPFSPKELVLRLRRVLAAAKPAISGSSKALERTLQTYRLCYEERSVIGELGAVYLTNKEFALLDCFARHKGTALSREQILRHVWGDSYFGSDRVVDDLVRRTRKKLQGLRVQTLYGYGYRVNA